ncbi:ABC transporter ATP-binding protein [Conexibacter stalactiti]|uniref:ABC transporter ATP-binding protein n=1 Tax=Conexibacter stalactiti TaxID=1940611 RepID=A0ABU4HKN7_9ACTN|nr:ABC transporter ATP-binding protein [Conexibacter stalactiti]MDW5593886.1 ABC transporter ATP-binding protein [Conexibacter stalactiti]MEC5034528.1 ABC transporter ATP-binding protein [Conexibacter stalactiti]
MADATVTSATGTAVLSVDGLSVSYPAGGGRRTVVDDVGFELRRGEMLGLVGESGSGKSTTAMSVLGLIKPPGRVDSGSVLLDGVDLRALGGEQLRRRRWSEISLVPQGAMSALNPVMRVGAQIADVIEVHERRRASGRRIDELLASVGLPVRTARLYPHELSGGMKQRVCIAMAIALNPKVMVADEPTSALDVIVQKAVAETLKDVQQRLGMAVVIIGHDMALQAQLADRVGVMCRGRLVEIGPVRSIFRSPAHPYTRLLLQAVPSLRQREWYPAAATQALRDEALALVAARHPLAEVGPDHKAAMP